MSSKYNSTELFPVLSVFLCSKRVCVKLTGSLFDYIESDSYAHWKKHYWVHYLDLITICKVIVYLTFFATRFFDLFMWIDLVYLAKHRVVCIFIWAIQTWFFRNSNNENLKTLKALKFNDCSMFNMTAKVNEALWVLFWLFAWLTHSF